MLRRTFAKTILATCSLPFWPFPKIKEKINNSELIKRLLKEGKDFSVSFKNNEEGANNAPWKCNIIRKKRRYVDVKQLLQDRLNMSEEEKAKQDNYEESTFCGHCGKTKKQCRYDYPSLYRSRILHKTYHSDHWYKFKFPK